MNPLADYFASNIDFTGTSADGFSDHIAGDGDRQSVGNKPKAAAKASQRVCDRCIIKKVKCDMKRPSCARCLEVDTLCVYSVKKRKPGPAKGSKHARRRISKDTTTSVSNASSPDSCRTSEGQASHISQWQKDQQSKTNTPTSDSLNEVPTTIIFGQEIPVSNVPPIIPSPLAILPARERQRLLLENFLLHIHPSIPLFHHHRLMARFETESLDQHLLLAICVVTAKILGLTKFWDGSSLDECTVYLFDLKTMEHEGSGRPLSLDNWRQACLLAFYAFHQYPGDRSWMRIGTLTRKAYQCGLHQIDYHQAGSYFDKDKISPEIIEEWRYVWWCIYCLDSYSNVTAVTPFIVENETVKTALVSTSLTAPATMNETCQALRFIPDDTDVLWRLAKEVTSSSGEINFNMHILTTTLIREAATILRLRKQSTSKRIMSRLADLEVHFSSFRLALPARYLNASRNAFVDESGAEHHARLICVIHIQLAKLLTYFPYDPQVSLLEWTSRWQRCLECVEDIVSIAKQWDGQYFTATDPAICFIISTSIILLHLHSCAADASLEFKVRMDTQADVLMLFLEQFASSWSLPRFLIVSCKQFKEIIKGPLTPLETDRLITVASGPISYRWLNFLSLEQDFGNLDNPGSMFENLLTQEWNSNDWEALWPMTQD